MSETRIQSVAIKGNKVDLEFSKENGAGNRDTCILHCNDLPRPSFTDALAALKVHVLAMLGLEEAYGETLFILSVAFKYKGKEDTMGCSISCQKNLLDGKRPLVFTTPYRALAVESKVKGKKKKALVQLDVLTKDCVDALLILQKEAVEYLDGQRVQLQLNLGSDEPKKIGPVEAKESSNRLKEAKAIIVETQRASTAMLEKRLKVTFKEAAEIMDELEAEGIIGPATGSGNARKILVAA